MEMKTCSIFIAATIFMLGILFSRVNSQAVADSCSSNIDLVNVQLPFDTTSFNCNPVWSPHGFILRYKQTGASEWSYVLSAPNSNAYIGMGFSPNGQMVGSSAIVGWVGSDGTPAMKKYYLGGKNSNQVMPDQGNLEVGNSTIVTFSSRIYMAFQLVNTDTPDSLLIYSFGPPNQIPSPPSFRLTQHSDYVSTVLNYATGQTQTTSTNTNSLRKSHGILVMLGWGILMAIGAMVARYMRQWDPIWFYSHAAIQSLGFMLGLAGIITGLVLSNRVSANVDKHKAIGITVLVLGCLQLMAVLARPDKESKVRKYWNWYHHGVGRALIVLAAANVFYGIHISDAGSSWNAGYAVVLAALFVVALILEIRMRIRD
ncbi:cytochrome b561 and DOMON domain-containing protein At3g07570 [Coffea arabica]|uniref:Cytochrome b561 and DOMON domain-containing protein At3g07570 n=1 Tax=Coffea arabica TaxID=13443 RepID=A0A6P6WF09_COFAR|nr:cytochrome b561 and DOMON domain-containing protein At3g07570-like [Coffea arabica]